MACSRREPLKCFEEQTTFRIAYVDHKKKRGYNRIYDAHHPPFTHRPEKEYKTKPVELKDIHTMEPWTCLFPFEVGVIPKPITRTHPYQKFNPNMEIEDVAKDEIIKNRPRVYMLPQICMDEVSDPELRNLIIKNMYISDWKKITGEIQHYCTKREIPDTVVEDPTKRKIDYPYDMLKCFPPGWEEKAKKWEEEYPDRVVDQTELFWQNFKGHKKDTPVPQDPLRKFLPENTRKEIRELIKTDELRRAYDYPIPGYMGYRPTYEIGPLKRKYTEKSSTQHLWTKDMIG